MNKEDLNRFDAELDDLVTKYINVIDIEDIIKSISLTLSPLLLMRLKK